VAVHCIFPDLFRNTIALNTDSEVVNVTKLGDPEELVTVLVDKDAALFWRRTLIQP
jgi:hypothetical protein